MSNMPDVNRTFIGLYLPIELAALVKREAATRKMTVTDFVQYLLQKAIRESKTQLEETDIEWIHEELKKNLAKRERKTK